LAGTSATRVPKAVADVDIAQVRPVGETLRQEPLQVLPVPAEAIEIHARGSAAKRGHGVRDALRLLCRAVDAVRPGQLTHVLEGDESAPPKRERPAGRQKS
jgi:hypothetical protein